MGICGVLKGSSRDIALGAEADALTREIGPTKCSAEPGSQLFQRSGGPTPGYIYIVHAKMCLARPGTTSSGERITGIGGITGGDPPAQNPSGGRKIDGLGGSGTALCQH